MLDFFDSLYSSIIPKNSFLEKIKFYSLSRFIVRNIANFLIPIYLLCTSFKQEYKLQNNIKTSDRLVISLTTFPSRINKIWMVIESMLRQTIKPDMIILWLSKEQFNDVNKLPNRLLKLRNRGLKIELRDEDLRSHKKYYYAFKEYNADNIITIDDDIFYRTNMVERLLYFHGLYPNSIIANYCHLKQYDEDLNILPYKQWKINVHEIGPNSKLFFGTGGGTLFPKNCLTNRILDKDVFMQICKNADDVWLNAFCELENMQIVKTDYYSIILPIISINNIKLSETNIDFGNDEQINRIRFYILNKFDRHIF